MAGRALYLLLVVMSMVYPGLTQTTFEDIENEEGTYESSTQRPKGDNSTSDDFFTDRDRTKVYTESGVNDTTGNTSQAWEQPHPASTPRLMVIAQQIDQYGGGFSLVIGSVGNALSMVIFRRPRFKNVPSTKYWFFLSLSDFFLVGIGQGFRHFIRAVQGRDPATYYTWYCKTWYLVVPTLTAFSSYVLVGVTVERCVAVCAPLHAKSIFSSRASQIYMLVSLVSLLTYYIYSLVFYEIMESQRGPVSFLDCNLNKTINPLFIKVRTWFEFAVMSVVPACTIMVANIITMVMLYRATYASPLASLSNNQTPQSNKASLTAMISTLLLVSFAYVILTTPIRVAFLMGETFPAGYWSASTRAQSNRLLWALSIFCLYLNHSVNFLLYFISGREFRRELLKMVRGWKIFRRKRTSQDSAVQQTTTTQATADTSLESKTP